jgi:hypothetical protein
VPVPRDPALRPYRFAVYGVYALCCGFLFVQLLRSVIGDLYGRPAVSQARASPTVCLYDVERLYAQLAARAVQAAPGGLEASELSREFDAWSRRWENELESVSQRCQLEKPTEPVRRALAGALEGIEELRRSGQETWEEAQQVKESLAEARRLLKLK